VLIELDRHQEAVQLLLAARPGVAPDHEYLLLLSLANLVNSGRDPQAPEMLDQQIDGMQSGQLPVPPELEEQVQAIIRKVRGEDEVEVEPPKVIEAAMPSESPCDRCGNNDWRLPSMVVPTEVQIRPDLKLVCPQCGRVGVMQPPAGG